MRTKVAVFETVFEKVLSKTRPYMPPPPSGTSYVPIDTLSASHFPAQCTCFSPIADSFSKTNVLSLREVEAPRPRVGGTSRAWGGGPASNVLEEGRFGVAPLVAPGCLKMPKFIDFLCGCMLQEMVWAGETSTQRTRYDCAHAISCKLRFSEAYTCLAVDLKLLHACHDEYRFKGLSQQSRKCTWELSSRFFLCSTWNAGVLRAAARTRTRTVAVCGHNWR
jgi:hypothetical protein